MFRGKGRGKRIYVKRWGKSEIINKEGDTLRPGTALWNEALAVLGGEDGRRELEERDRKADL